MTKAVHQNLIELLEASVGAYRDQKAFTQVMPNGMFASLTFHQVREHARSFAAWLQSIGIRPGDRVAIQMPNCLAYPIVSFGTLEAGAVIVNTNPLYTAHELTHQLADSGARVLVVIDMFADRLPDVIPKTQVEQVVVVRLSELFSPVVGGVIRLVQKYWNRQLPAITTPHLRFKDILAKGATRAFEPVTLGPQDIAALQYTGGTTGVSKGAVLTHGNLVANCHQMLAVAADAIAPGKETILTALPLYHVFAFTVNLLGFWTMGGHNVLIPSPRPISNLRRAIENHRITWISGVNTLFAALCNEFWFTESPPKTLKMAVAGGTALHAATAERWQRITGTPVVEGYGLTEASPLVSFNPLDAPKAGSIGLPAPGTEVRLLGEHGSEVAQGEPGELCLRGPQVMAGYWQRPEETAEVLQDGWLRTGDIAVRDPDGYLRIVDRKKDLILVSGFNVYPNEVEDALALHPKIAEVAVIGVLDESSGEAVKAFVVARDPSLTIEEIRRHAKERLTGYKIPKHVELRADLPKSPVGKILRKELRAEEKGAGKGKAA